MRVLSADATADPVGVDGAELTALLVHGLDESAILTLDVEGRVVTWNAGAQRMHGYAAEEIIGRHFSVLHPSRPSQPAGLMC